MLTLVTFKATWNMYARQAESERNLNNAAAAAESLKQREVELMADIQKLETDRGVEEEVRKKYSVVKPGEDMVVLVDESAPAGENNGEKRGFFGRMWDKVKGVFGGGDDEWGEKAES